ncbi:MAG: hypothetical protein IJR88_02860 [Clostridia bacterium]|nr:hypothetical protein [Clostridia bacterium]
MAGTVASTVVTAVLVVAVFVSTLSINISLAMSTISSLVFQVEMTGAQEEDFQTPIFAILTGEDGTEQIQEVRQDTVYLTFENLSRATEYTIQIRNEEKIFAEKSYFTAEEEIIKGSISASMNENQITVSVENVRLSPGEYYTVLAKDEAGKSVFAKDAIEPDAEFQFEIPEPNSLYFTLEIDGIVYDMASIIVEHQPDPTPDPEPTEPTYDLQHGTWTWNDDCSEASVSFADLNGGEPLVLSAIVEKKATDPTCEEDGFTVCSATVEYEGSVYSKEQKLIDEGSALGHKYGEPTFEWIDEEGAYVSVTATFVCANDEAHVEEIEALLESVETPATCEKDAYITYTATLTFEEEEYSDEKVVVIEGSALGHDYGEPTFEWIEEQGRYVSVTATFVCTTDETHVEVIEARLESVETPATCEEDAYITYTATLTSEDEEDSEETHTVPLTSEGEEYSDKKVVVIEGSALGHEYGEPTFEWIDEQGTYVSATATFVCANDETHVEEIEALLESVETPATCEENAYITYTATVTFLDETYSEEQVVVIEGSALGHDYGEPTFEWIDEQGTYVSATATFVCANDETHIEEIEALLESVETPATCTEDAFITYTATVTFLDETYSEEQVVVIEGSALGHEYGEPTFEWIEEEGFYVSATATFICANDETHVEEIEALLESVETPATCEEDAFITYTATVTFLDETYSDEQVVVIEGSALGHEYGEPSFEWIDEQGFYVSATATFICANDETHVEEIEALLESVETPATCEEDAFITYTATVTFLDETYSDEQVVVIEGSALGHEYGEPTFEWIDEQGTYVSATATFICANDETHVEEIEALLESVETPATCEEDAYITYTATVTFLDETYSDEQVVVIEGSALGHEYGEPTFEWIDEQGTYVSATATFICANDETHVEEIEALLESVETPATCTEDAFITYTATVTFLDETYSEEQVVVIEGSALGHEYGEGVFEWTEAGEGYSAMLVFTCLNDSTHRLEIEAEVGFEDSPADCEDDAYVIYYASVLYQDEEYNDEKVVTEEGSALGHTYEFYETVEADCETAGMMAHYHCPVCGKYFDVDQNEVSEDELILPAIGVASGDPTKLTSENLTGDFVGSKVYIMVDDGSVGVSLGQANNTATESGLFTQFTIEEVGNGTVTLVSPDGHYVVVEEGTLQFVSETATNISVKKSGSLSIGPSYNPYTIVYQSSMIQALSAVSLDAAYLRIYLLPSSGHDYEFIEENYNGNGLAAHYECSICHKLFDENMNETTEDELAISTQGDLPSGSPAEIIPIEGLTAITTDMLSGSQIDSSARLSANLFDGFVEANWSSISNMQFEDEGRFYIIYAFDSEGFYIGRFENGVCKNPDDEPYCDVSTTIEGLLELLNNGNRFYYTSDESLSGGQSNSGNVRLVTLEMLPENSDNIPTAADFEGFVAFDWEELKTWQLDIEGTIVVICGFNPDGFYMCSFADGVCNIDEPQFSDMSITNLRYMLSMETTPIYYTVGGEGGIVEGIKAITADMLSGDQIDPEGHPSANLLDGFVEGNWSSVSNMQFDMEGMSYVIFAFDEEGFYVCRFEDGVCTDVGANHDVDTTIANLLEMINGGLTFYYTVETPGVDQGEGGDLPSGDSTSGDLPGGDSASGEITFGDDNLYITPTGYARSESGLNNLTPFESSAESPYLIQNQNVEWCDNVIQVIQTDSSISEANVYIKLKDVTLAAGNYASLFRIEATNTINIVLIIEGEVTFAGGEDQQIFSSQGYGSPTVNIIIDETTAGGTFHAELTDGLTYAETGTINVSYH